MLLGGDRMRIVGKNAFTNVSAGAGLWWTIAFSFDVQPPTSRGNRTRYSQHHSADASERGAEFDVAAQNHGTTGGSNAY